MPVRARIKSAVAAVSGWEGEKCRELCEGGSGCVYVRVRYVRISGAFGYLNLQRLSGVENCTAGRTRGATCEYKHVPLI